MYTEKQMARRIRRLRAWIKAYEGIDVLVTHAPAEGYGDLDDLPHWGFDCFNDLLREYRPQLMLYGHVHKEYGDFQREIVHESGTKLINCYGSVMIPFDDDMITERSAAAKRRIRLLKWMNSRGE
jgi:Icc-related predicted phosphoesterase